MWYYKHSSRRDLQSVVIEIDASRLEQLFHDEARSIDSRLTPQLCIDDPHIEALICNMWAEVKAAVPPILCTASLFV